MAEIILATPTGIKIVDSKTNAILKHVGTKKEIEEHAKRGHGVTDLKNKKLTQTELDEQKRLFEKEKAEFEKTKKEFENNKQSETITPASETIECGEFLSKNKWKKLTKEEQENYIFVPHNGYKLKEGIDA